MSTESMFSRDCFHNSWSFGSCWWCCIPCIHQVYLNLNKSILNDVRQLHELSPSHFIVPKGMKLNLENYLHAAEILNGTDFPFHITELKVINFKVNHVIIYWN